MILADYALCSDPPGYPLCRSCRRNLDNHDARTMVAVVNRHRQAHVAPDDRENCRHWDAHWASGPESRP